MHKIEHKITSTVVSAQLHHGTILWPSDIKIQTSCGISYLGPFYGAIAVPSVTRCRCGHRFYIAIAGFGSSWYGVDSSDTW